jgi:hypothetical protein
MEKGRHTSGCSIINGCCSCCVKHEVVKPEDEEGVDNAFVMLPHHVKVEPPTSAELPTYSGDNQGTQHMNYDVIQSIKCENDIPETTQTLADTKEVIYHDPISYLRHGDISNHTCSWMADTKTFTYIEPFSYIMHSKLSKSSCATNVTDSNEANGSESLFCMQLDTGQDLVCATVTVEDKFKSDAQYHERPLDPTQCHERHPDPSINDVDKARSSTATPGEDCSNQSKPYTCDKCVKSIRYSSDRPGISQYTLVTNRISVLRVLNHFLANYIWTYM